MKDFLRYEAQLRLPGWDQNKLLSQSALIIGVGGLGTPAALYLAAMGIGKLIIADPDVVAEENLHRQPLYTPKSIGAYKAHCIKEYLLEFRPDLHVEAHTVWVNEGFLRDIGSSASIWIDGTDNIASRLVIDEMAFASHKPWVYGAIYQWEGQAALFYKTRYRDFFGAEVCGDSCSEGGVMGGIPGIVGSLQASLAAMYLASPFSAPTNHLFRIDLLRGRMESFRIGTQRVSNALEIGYNEAHELSEALWIDIREVCYPCIPRAQRKNWYDWDEWELPQKPIILICERGNRSRQIAFGLRKKTRREDIYSLEGGASLLFAATKQGS
ncbi:MAG: HesA/MoeB/ThiF family protein [Bacteroidia bacterium]|nr:HesA/MoeB/ThiF family protein [Bacteroidia bacterium]